MKKLVLVAMTIVLMGIGYETASSAEVQSLPLRGTVHLQEYGNRTLQEGKWAGVAGKSLRLESFTIDFSPPTPDLGLEYMCHLQDKGDKEWMVGGSVCGWEPGDAKRLEGFAIKLTGAEAEKYDVYYACHLQGTGNKGPFANGAFCGTKDEERRLEAMIVWVLPKGSPPPEVPPPPRRVDPPPPRRVDPPPSDQPKDPPPSDQPKDPPPPDQPGGLAGSFSFDACGRQDFPITVIFEGEWDSGPGQSGRTSFSVRVDTTVRPGPATKVPFSVDGLRRGTWKITATSTVTGEDTREASVPGYVLLSVASPYYQSC